MAYKDDNIRRERQREYMAKRRADPDLRELDRARQRKKQKERPEIHRAANRRNAANRREMLAEIKTTRGCVDCGYNLSHHALHFDHRDPALKSFNVSMGMTKSWDILWAEVAKCDIRCANCHAIRTHNEGHSKTRRKPC